MNTILHYEITGRDAGKTVAAYLSAQGYSSRLIAHLRKTENSFLSGESPVFSNHRLNGGEVLTVCLSEKKSSGQILPVPMNLSVLFEDEHLMVIDKPAGMPVHPSQGNHDNTLANAVAWYLREKGETFVFRAVNRLDRDTSGLLLLAKNMVSACILYDAVRKRGIRREYLAIALGRTEASGTVAAPIARLSGSTIERAVDFAAGEPAVTHYRTAAYQEDADLSLLHLLLETGRTHQIRVHMKYIGHPLPGDFLYCPDYRYIGRQALHSASLSFRHPVTGEFLHFTSPLPEDMARLFPEQPHTRRSPFG